jgi:predicted Zn-dependent peptidase
VETAQLDEGLKRTTAPNGLVVLTETLPGVRSAAVGIYVRTASAHESRSQLGISHLLEHMVFKGTERRTAQQLALELEIRGGGLDAFTGRDYTSYQAHVLDADLPLAVEILTDLVRRPLLRQSDLEPERNVILEEINGVADTPDDLVFELHAEVMWPDHPYGYSILGTPDSLEKLSAEDLRNLHRNGYYRGNCVIAAAGHVNHDQLLTVLEREGWFEGGTREPARPGVTPAPAARGASRSEVRDTAQTHIVFGTDTFSLRDKRRFPLSILTNIFGGGMSSRLFQRVREELGLAYAIFAYKHFYQGSGQLGVYVGTQPSTADQAVEAIRAEYARIATEALPAVELANGKQQLKGQVMLSLESPAARMGRLAGFVLHEDRYRPLDEMLAEIDAVTTDDVAAVASEFFAPDRQTIVRLGPGNGKSGGKAVRR